MNGQELNDILVKRLPSGCRLTVCMQYSIQRILMNSQTTLKALFDSCHSGTILDLPYTRFFGPRSKSPPKEAILIDETIRTSSPTPETVFDPQEGAYSLPQSPSDVPKRQKRRGPLGTPSY